MKCRKLISDHIGELFDTSDSVATNTPLEEELHLAIAADKVRLITRPEDPYRWVYLAERRHLFEKPLSKHNVGAYKEICRELGQSLGVRARDDGGCEESTDWPKSESTSNQTVMDSRVVSGAPRSRPDTFISRIESLRRTNAALREVVASLKSSIIERDQLNAKLEQRQKELGEDAVVLRSELDLGSKRLQASEVRLTSFEIRWKKIIANVEQCRMTSTALHEQLMNVLEQ